MQQNFQAIVGDDSMTTFKRNSSNNLECVNWHAKYLFVLQLPFCILINLLEEAKTRISIAHTTSKYMLFGPFNILKHFMRIINVFGSNYTVNCNNVIIAENCMTHDFEDHRNKG